MKGYLYISMYYMDEKRRLEDLIYLRSVRDQKDDEKKVDEKKIYKKTEVMYFVVKKKSGKASV